MTKQIWLNLPVKNIEKSKKFFSSIGFSFNEEWSRIIGLNALPNWWMEKFPLVDSLMNALMNMLVKMLMNMLVPWLNHWLIHSLMNVLIHSLIHCLIHWLIHCLNRWIIYSSTNIMYALIQRSGSNRRGIIWRDNHEKHILTQGSNPFGSFTNPKFELRVTLLNIWMLFQKVKLLLLSSMTTALLTKLAATSPIASLTLQRTKT